MFNIIWRVPGFQKRPKRGIPPTKAIYFEVNKV